jgi:hypothetical protein
MTVSARDNLLFVWISGVHMIILALLVARLADVMPEGQ